MSALRMHETVSKEQMNDIEKSYYFSIGYLKNYILDSF